MLLLNEQYSFRPWLNVGLKDGIVLEERRIRGTLPTAATLLHEIGHWLGLGHTFGDSGQNCKVDDGLLNTTQTSGLDQFIGLCVQPTCAGGTETIYNVM